MLIFELVETGLVSLFPFLLVIENYLGDQH
jgi:hypothetical protein